MKLAQLYSQVFIYLLTVVLVSFILVYGYSAVKSFKDKADDVACLKFRNDLQNIIETTTSDFGTVKRKDINLCGKFTKASFVESFGSPNLPWGGVDPIIEDSVRSNSEKNVFLVEDIAKESFYAGKISVEPDVMCISATSGKISLRLEGRGNHVVLSAWT